MSTIWIEPAQKIWINLVLPFLLNTRIDHPKKWHHLQTFDKTEIYLHYSCVCTCCLMSDIGKIIFRRFWRILWSFRRCFKCIFDNVIKFSGLKIYSVKPLERNLKKIILLQSYNQYHIHKNLYKSLSIILISKSTVLPTQQIFFVFLLINFKIKPHKYF